MHCSAAAAAKLYKAEGKAVAVAFVVLVVIKLICTFPCFQVNDRT